MHITNVIRFIKLEGLHTGDFSRHERNEQGAQHFESENLKGRCFLKGFLLDGKIILE